MVWWKWKNLGGENYINPLVIVLAWLVISHADQPEPLGQIPSMYDEVNVIAYGIREDIRREIIVACAMQQ